jgi:hypothetical protein
MTVFLPNQNGAIERVEMGKLARREPLAAFGRLFSKDRMMENIRFLSSTELAGR